MKTMLCFTLNKIERCNPRVFVFVVSVLLLFFVQLFDVARFLQTYSAYSLSGLSFSDNAKRTTLIRKALADPDIFLKLPADEVALVLQKPMLSRVEADITSWHYHGESCAIDIYFKDEDDHPEYVEFRALTLNQDVQDRFGDEDPAYLSKYCMRIVLETQGVDTPSSMAERPLPSWKSPYRS